MSRESQASRKGFGERKIILLNPFPRRRLSPGVMFAAAAFLSLFVGLALGALGGGGSILMLPILVYALEMPAHVAVTVSLLVVGSTSAAVLLVHARAGQVRWKVGALFGAAGMFGSVVGSRLSLYLPSWMILTIFAALMLGTASSMLRKKRTSEERERPVHLGLALPIGALVGLFSGLVGAGGGFLIVPALTMIAGLPIRNAIATSLLVISMQSLSGFTTHALQQDAIPWTIALTITFLAIIGSMLGARLASRIPAQGLRRAFGVLVLVLGAFVLLQQLPRELWSSAFSPATSALFGGALIGAAAAMLWLLNGRVAGISGIVGGLVARASDRSWRVSFLGGLLIGGALLGWLRPESFASSPASTPMIITAGLLVGLGTTIGNGCTSGHGVCGVSRLSPRSIIATLTFISIGMAVVSLVRGAVGGAQ